MTNTEIKEVIEILKKGIKITEPKVIDKKSLVNKKRREKYQRLRQLGYTPDEARRLRGFKFDTKAPKTKIEETINERLDLSLIHIFTILKFRNNDTITIETNITSKSSDEPLIRPLYIENTEGSIAVIMPLVKE